MITIIDYGMGNLRSVQKAFEHLGFEAIVTRNKKKIREAPRLVLPGVGAFKDCMDNLAELELVGPILDFIQSGKPFLGICLGMQLLFTESEEFGTHKGLDFIPGKVVRFSFKDQKLPIPHMGWNQIKKKNKSKIFESIPQESYVYFVHSYHVVPKDPKVILTTTEYGDEFVSSIQKDNVLAVQFHPEKSQTIGLEILKAFAQTS